MLEIILWCVAFAAIPILGRYLIGISGIILPIIATILGYIDYSFLNFILPAALFGLIVYSYMNLNTYTLPTLQDGIMHFLGWSILVYLAQAVTWGLFFGLGKLFAILISYIQSY